MRETGTSRADNGRKKREIQFPRRERVLVREALRKLGVTRTFENVRVWNPEYSTKKGDVVGGWQWIDFVFVHRHRLYAILFEQTWTGGPHKYQTRWMEQKKSLLTKRNLPHITLRRAMTGQEYQMRIYKLLHLSQSGRGTGHVR
jgi:hypothetical protein